MTRPFRFRLETVLEYRRQLEEQAKLALAGAQQAYRDAVAHTRRARQAMEAHDAAGAKAMSAAELWLWRNYKARLVQEVADAERRMMERAQSLNHARKEAVVRAKDRNLLEKLESKQKRRHDEEEAQREQKEFDEAATLRYSPQNL